MARRYEGGCAVMLDVPGAEIANLRGAALTWIAYRQEWEDTLEAPHLTLQFVGRDLLADDCARVIAAAFAFAEASGVVTVRFPGAMEFLSTAKGTYLVAAAEARGQLKDARDLLRATLDAVRVKPRDTFDFRPHVTLAEAPPGAGKEPQPVQTSANGAVAVCRSLTVKYGKHRMTVEL